jgi:acetylornithine deacetylase/succinyl-diaminopimelate desuccinylase-like protein
MTTQIMRLPNRGPVLLVEVPATTSQRPDDCILLYGHMDKQPEMTGWRAGLGPWTPVIEGDKLFAAGRR